MNKEFGVGIGYADGYTTHVLEAGFVHECALVTEGLDAGNIENVAGLASGNSTNIYKSLVVSSVSSGFTEGIPLVTFGVSDKNHFD